MIELKLGDAGEVQTLNSAMQYVYKKSEDAKRHLRMTVKAIQLDDLLNAAWYDLTAKGLTPSDYHMHLERNAYANSIIGDLYYLKPLLINATEYAMKNSKNDPISLIVDDVSMQYDLPSIYKNEAKKSIRIVLTNNCNLRLPKKIYAPYENDVGKENLVPQALRNNIRIVKAHFGFFDYQKSKDYITQVYVLPINLKSIRPKIKYFAYDELFDEVRIDSPEDQLFLSRVVQKGMQDGKIKLAMQVAKHYHFGQFRNRREHYYLHPLSVATILLDCTDDENLIVAALLHDTIEDTPYEVSQMKTMFGDRVTRIVKEVAHLYSKNERPKIKLEKKETLDLLIKNGNLDSLLVKLADRLHNIRTIDGNPSPSKRKSVAEETLKVFVPIALRLGFDGIEKELKYRSLEVLKNS